MTLQEEPKESDWKTFRRIVPELRERYLERVNAELLAILQSEGNTPTEQFWALEERIRNEAKTLRDCLDGHRRSGMKRSMLLMYRYGMIDDDDLNSFSEELRDLLVELKDL